MNQAIFERFLVGNDLENGLKVDAKLVAPFAQRQEPINDNMVKINNTSPKRAKALICTIKTHLQAYFGDGFSGDVLLTNSSSKALMGSVDKKDTCYKREQQGKRKS